MASMTASSSAPTAAGVTAMTANTAHHIMPSVRAGFFLLIASACSSEPNVDEVVVTADGGIASYRSGPAPAAATKELGRYCRRTHGQRGAAPEPRQRTFAELVAVFPTLWANIPEAAPVVNSGCLRAGCAAKSVERCPAIRIAPKG